MKESLKISGRKIALPEMSGVSGAPVGWKLTERPGGWVVAESPEGARMRFMLHEARGKLAFTMATGAPVTFQGEVAVESRAGASGAGSDSDLIAQFPGKVRKVLVAEGATVAAGDPLLLVEAMKMEFPVVAPFSGVVTKLLVKEGQQLSPGDRFLELKAEDKTK